MEIKSERPYWWAHEAWICTSNIKSLHYNMYEFIMSYSITCWTQFLHSSVRREDCEVNICIRIQSCYHLLKRLQCSLKNLWNCIMQHFHYNCPVKVIMQYVLYSTSTCAALFRDTSVTMVRHQSTVGTSFGVRAFGVDACAAICFEGLLPLFSLCSMVLMSLPGTVFGCGCTAVEDPQRLNRADNTAVMQPNSTVYSYGESIYEFLCGGGGGGGGCMMCRKTDFYPVAVQMLWAASAATKPKRGGVVQVLQFPPHTRTIFPISRLIPPPRKVAPVPFQPIYHSPIHPACAQRTSQSLNAGSAQPTGSLFALWSSCHWVCGQEQVGVCHVKTGRPINASSSLVSCQLSIIIIISG